MYIEKIVEAADVKYSLAKNNVLLFLVKTFLGGIFVVFGTIAAYSVASILFKISPDTGLATIGVGLTFTLALLTIIFFGGELFTSGVFVMAIGVYAKKYTILQTLRVWCLCYLGNMIAIVFFLSLYCLTESYPTALVDYVNYAVPPKFNYTIAQLLFKGMFCNFAVCCGYYATVRMTNEAAKFLMIFICIFSFVVSGFEHCVANMAYFTISFFVMDDFPMMLALKNLLFSTIGNIIGGGIVLALPVYLLERKSKV